VTRRTADTADRQAYDRVRYDEWSKHMHADLIVCRGMWKAGGNLKLIYKDSRTSMSSVQYRR
jgi:hypothetical protein